MEIVVFSDAKYAESLFKPFLKSKKINLTVYPTGDMTKKLKTVPAASLVYCDISGMDETESKKAFKQLVKLTNMYWGLIDGKGVIDDVSILFHEGMSDYISKGVIKKGVNAGRLDKIVGFKPIDAPLVEKTEKIQEQYGSLAVDWDSVEPGSEYAFVFMFIELDNQKELKSMGQEICQNLVNEFHDCVQSIIEPFSGKIWMWMDFGGLVLFPFDGTNYSFFEPALRLMLNRGLFSVEKMSLDVLLSYRIAFHVGTTIYEERGHTGSIVSDSINSIFHLGQKYATPGRLYCTETIYSIAPSHLQEGFILDGDYEGRKIMRLFNPWAFDSDLCL